MKTLSISPPDGPLMELGKPHKSVHVNFRISASCKALLEEQAARRDMHLNAYANHIFAKFTFLEENVEESSRVVFQKELLVQIMSLINPESIAKVGRYFGSRLLKPSLEYSRGRPTMVELCENYFIPMGIYSGWYRAKDAKVGSSHRLVLNHQYGPNWTIFLKEYYSAAIKPLFHGEVSINSHDGIVEVDYP